MIVTHAFDEIRARRDQIFAEERASSGISPPVALIEKENEADQPGIPSRNDADTFVCIYRKYSGAKISESFNCPFSASCVWPGIFCY
jgi:hypothetical protein